jgi:hypothetical protein
MMIPQPLSRVPRHREERIGTPLAPDVLSLFLERRPERRRRALLLSGEQVRIDIQSDCWIRVAGAFGNDMHRNAAAQQCVMWVCLKP